MAKLLLVLLVVVLGLWMLLRKRGAGDGRLSKRPDPEKPPQAAGELAAMVACTHCGVFVPAADAARDADGRPYCGDAHRALGPR